MSLNIVGQHVSMEEFVSRWATDKVLASQAYVYAVEQVVQSELDLSEEELKVALNGYFVKFINTKCIPSPLFATYNQGRVAYGVLIDSSLCSVKLNNVITVQHPF